jgi:2-oxoisovalerate dehydrogenase E1 component beta subunit
MPLHRLQRYLPTRALLRHHRAYASTGSAPPAEGFLDISSSTLSKQTREAALASPDIAWWASRHDVTVERSTKKLNLYQAVNEALATALATDDTARRS